MALVLALHGTRWEPGRTTYRQLVRRVQAALPPVVVRAGYLDVQTPTLDDVVQPGDVVVPVLLARGHHARVDCAAATGRGARVADAVGPDPRLVAVADARLAESGAGRDWPVVLVAAGSRDPV